MNQPNNPEELELQGDQRQPAMHEHGGLTITTQEIISIIKEVLIFKGIKAALFKYEDMCVTYARVAGWNITAQELSTWLAREIEKRRTAKHKRQKRGRKRKQRTDNISLHANQIILGNTIDIHQTDEKQDTVIAQQSFGEVPKATLDKLQTGVEQVRQYFWRDSAMAVIFCVCRDCYDYIDNMRQFERDFNCKEGLVSSTFRNNPYMRLHVDKWLTNGAKDRALKLAVNYKDAVDALIQN